MSYKFHPCICSSISQIIAQLNSLVLEHVEICVYKCTVRKIPICRFSHMVIAPPFHWLELTHPTNLPHL